MSPEIFSNLALIFLCVAVFALALRVKRLEDWRNA